MHPTCEDWLPVLRPHLTEPLFDPGALKRLRTLAHRLSGEGLGVLETRLAQGPGPIDLSLQVVEPGHARRLAERLPCPRAGSFLRRWAEPGGPFAWVPSVWLEYDLDREPRPVVCAKLRPDAGLPWLLDSLLPALHGKPLAGAQRRLVRRCHEAIPAPASLLYAFSLRSRGNDAVRMEIFGLEPAAILDYLRAVVPHADPRVEDAAPLVAGVERIHLSFDIGPAAILPRIGIEGSFSSLPCREPRWSGLLDRLVDRGLCTPGRRAALLSWTGYDTFWSAPQSWPAATAGVNGFCVRSLSHLKVVCDPGRDLEAKAYLMFGPRRSGEGRSERQRQLGRELLAAGDVAGDPQLPEPAAGLAEVPRRLLGTP